MTFAWKMPSFWQVGPGVGGRELCLVLQWRWCEALQAIAIILDTSFGRILALVISIRVQLKIFCSLSALCVATLLLEVVGLHTISSRVADLPSGKHSDVCCLQLNRADSDHWGAHAFSLGQ